MKRSTDKVCGWSLVAIVCIGVLCLAAAADAGERETGGKVRGKCMTCHKKESPGIYNQWRHSSHGQNDVTCYDCHEAAKSEADAFEHEGATIATLVTPKDCSHCHEKETEQVARSHHASAGKILHSKDAYLAHAVGGAPVAQAGCESCHGTTILIDPDSPNKLSLKTWPNSGIGRINPDGSLGSCTACHARHSFDKAQARRPEACGKCHLGPDHPQEEIFEASKHGNAYFAHEDEMNLDADRWVVGQDYYEAPTCATCHMSATRNQEVTHDVGQRISWTLRPPISKHKENWRDKRENMKDVCSACHGSVFVDGHFRVFDGVVNLYDEKFAKPATEIITLIRKRGLLEHEAAFSNDVEWAYWELWHHEGRRARHGAAMMSPDYTWWNGMYEVAQNFYFRFLPQARAFDDPEVNALIDKVMNRPMHAWFNRSTEDIKKDIREGRLQEIYANLFDENFAEE